MTRKQLHELVKGSSQRCFDEKLEDLDKKLMDITNYPPEKEDELLNIIKAFKPNYKRRWQLCHRIESRFLDKNEEWLSEEIILPIGILPGRSKGRPSKEFGESSDRTKRRKTVELRRNVSVDELTYAAQMSQRATGNNDVAKVIQTVTKTPTRAMKFRKAAAIGSKALKTKKHSSSPRWCRPIRIRYLKENKDITNEEIEYIENQAQNLQATKVSDNIRINHVLLPTMVDGKVCNAATNTSSTLRCYICGKTSKSFNDLSSTEPENPETFRFGLSILHARIRFFEILVHLSYKLKADVHKGRVTDKSDREKIQAAKRQIQKEFHDKLGLLVDIPKAGFGNTNDGNTSRRFFNSQEGAASITGVDLSLINKFKTILEVISSGYEIDLKKFEKFTMDTAKHYVSLYPWQPMSPTVHKILIHSASVISHALLPIGQLSEEAAEARNKHFRQYREKFSRKFSRTACNEDVINRLLLTSDPYLSSLRTKSKTKKQSFSK